MKQIRLFSLILVLCLFMAGTTAHAQAVGDYGSKATGNWGTDGSNWIVCVADGTWEGATNAPGAPASTNNVWIRSGHVVTAETTGKNCNTLTIESNGKLVSTSASGSNNVTVATSILVKNNGTYSLLGTASNFGTSWTNVTLEDASTVEFIGTQSSLPTTSGTVTFGNLVWSPSTGTIALAQSSTVVTLIVKGNLTINKDATTAGKIRGCTTNFAGSVTHTVYGDLIMNNSSASNHCLSLANSTPNGNVTFEVKGNVYLNSGRITMFESSGSTTPIATLNIGGNFTIGSAAILQFGSNSANAGTATINIKGNITNNNNSGITKNSGGGGTFTINLNGTHQQNWTGALPLAFTSTTSSIKIDNSAGIILNNAATVNSLNTILLTNGVLKLGSNDLTVATGGLISGGSSSSFVVTNGTGTLTMPAPAGVATLFPVGASASSYDPVTVKPATASNFSVKVGTTLSGPAVNCTLNEKEWDITPVTPSETELTLTPSAITATGLDPIIGHFESGAYKYKKATQVGNSYTGTFSSFSPFVTGASDVISATENISNALFVSINGGKAYLNGTTEGQLISVYGTNGQLIKNIEATGNYTALQLNKGIYVVKVSNETMKVVL